MGKLLGSNTVDVVGLSGKARSGKNYLAEHAIVPQGFIPLALANQFKVDAVIRHGAPWDQVFGPSDKDPEIRNLLQKMGTEWGREDYGEDVWCFALELWMLYFFEMGLDRFVITDVRFPNEVEWIHSLGGAVFRIVGRGGAETDETQQHASETALDGHEDLFDFTIDNSEAREEKAVQELSNIVDTIFD